MHTHFIHYCSSKSTAVYSFNDTLVPDCKDNSYEKFIFEMTMFRFCVCVCVCSVLRSTWEKILKLLKSTMAHKFQYLLHVVHD